MTCCRVSGGPVPGGQGEAGDGLELEAQEEAGGGEGGGGLPGNAGGHGGGLADEAVKSADDDDITDDLKVAEEHEELFQRLFLGAAGDPMEVSAALQV